MSTKVVADHVAAIYALEGGVITEEIAKGARSLVMTSIRDIHFLLLQHLASKDGAGKEEIFEHAKKLAIRNCRGQGLPRSRLETLVTKKESWKAMQKNNPRIDFFSEFVAMMESNNMLEYREVGRKKRFVTVSGSDNC